MSRSGNGDHGKQVPRVLYLLLRTSWLMNFWLVRKRTIVRIRGNIIRNGTERFLRTHILLLRYLSS